MNFIKELTYAHHIAQASRSAKDKKQHSKYYQHLKEDTHKNESKGSNVSLVEKFNDELYQGEDRRAGEDRRKDSINRGRYLDSRQKKNRRSTQEVEITI